MSGFRIPGPLCITRTEPIDAGTSCLWRTPSPGPVCSQSEAVRRWHLMSVSGGFAPTGMSVSPDGVALLKAVEQLRLEPYDDQTGEAIDQWAAGATVGFGHLIAKADWGTYKDGITEAVANALFATDLAPFEAVVGSSISVGLQQYEYDALVIFAFNIGKSGFGKSSVVKLVNDPAAVTAFTSLEAAWKAWNKSQGKVMKGLDNRRYCEWKIYTVAVYVPW